MSASSASPQGRPHLQTVCGPVLATLLAVFGAGCEDEGSLYRPGSPADISAPEWNLDATARVGGIEGEPLTSIGQVLIGRDGQMYVSQPDEAIVRVFQDSMGSVDTIGGRGEGPGEFGGISSIGHLGDTIYVGDNALGPISYFDPQGEVLGSESWFAEGGPLEQGAGPDVLLQRTVPQALLPDGHALLLFDWAVSAPPPEATLISENTRVPYVRIDEHGHVVDTVAWDVEEVHGVALESTDRPLFVWSPWSEAPLTELMPDGSGIAFAEQGIQSGGTPGEGARLGKIDPFGEPVWVVQLPRSRRAIEEEDVLEAAEEVRSDLPNTEGSQIPAQEIAEALQAAGFVPDSVPLIHDLVGTQDGSLWVRLAPADDGDAEWWVFSPDGEPSGRVALPEGQTVLAASGQALIALELDRFGVPTLVSYRVAGES